MPSASWANGWITGDVVTATEFKKGVGAIYDTTLTVSAASIDVTGLPTTYAHLMLVAYLRGDTAAVAVAVNARFNNDSAANYSSETLSINGTTVTASEQIAASTCRLGRVPAATAPASAFGSVRADLPNYGATSGHKAGTAQSASRENTTSTNIFQETNAFIWFAAAAAINRITLFPATGNFIVGSRLSIYAMGS